MHRTRAPHVMTCKLIATVLLFFAALGPKPTGAAMCTLTHAEHLISGPYRAEVLFRGVAKENRGAWTRFQVTQVWAGANEGSLWVRRDASEPSVEVSYQIGGNYLVIAEHRQDHIIVTACNTILVRERLNELVQLLGIR